MLEIARLKLYDRILGKDATSEFDSVMQTNFEKMCEECGLETQSVKDELGSVAEEVAEDLEVGFDDDFDE